MITACNPEVKAPVLNRPQDTPYAACTNTNLDLRKLTEDSVRSFVDCLNGTEGRIQAYKDLVDELEADELKVLLHIYNTHMVNEARFKKGLELYHKMLIGGQFDSMMSAFAAMSDAGVLRTLLPLFKNLYATQEGKSDPAIESLNKFIVKLIERDQFNDSLITLAKLMDNGRINLVTKFISMGSYLPGFDSKKIVEDLSNALYYGIETGGFKEISILMYDPTNYQMFKDVIAITPGGLPGVNSYFEYLALNSVSGDLLSDLSQLTRATNVSADCFTQSGDPQRLDNLFVLGFEEVKSRRLNTQEQIAEFYLEEVPFHLQNLKGQCDLPVNLTRLYPSFTDILKDGYGMQLTALEMAFDNYQRLTYLTDIMSSNQIQSVVSGIANTADRNILAYLLDMLTKDLDQKDYYTISQLFNYLMIEDLDGEKTKKWLESAPGMDESLRSELIRVQLNTNLGLIELLQYFDTASVKSASYHGLAARLRRYLGKYDFVDAPSNYVLPVLRKLVSPNGNARADIESYVDSLLKLWAKNEDGIGKFVSAMAATLNVSKDMPIQEFVKDVLSDKEFVKAINPILLKLVEKESFLGAIELTADLGRTGELSRLLEFLYSLTINMPLDSLDPEPLGKPFEEFNGDPNDYYRDYSFTPTPLLKDYTGCTEVLNHSGSWNSNYVRALADCFSMKTGGDADEILQLLEGIVLESGLNAIDILAGFVSHEVLSSAYFYPLLNSLETHYYNGNIDQVFDLLVSLGRSSTEVIGDIESLIVSSCENGNELKTPNWLIRFVQEEGSEKTFAMLPRLLLGSQESSIPELNFSPLSLSEDDLARAQVQWDKYKDGLADQNWRKDEEAYVNAMIRDYTHRTDNYYYGQSLYENPEDHAGGEAGFYVEFIRQMIRYSTRGDSILATLNAMKSLENMNYPWLEFLDYSTRKVDLIPYYIGKSKRPLMRFATPLERAEILVQNSRLAVAKSIPGLGVADVGTHFQIELAKSKNRKSTLGKLEDMIDLGLTYTKIFNRKEKRNRLKNIDKNFSVLKDLEEEGYLIFFAEVYKHLYQATPKGDRKQDRDRIYTSLVHEPMKLGIFSHLSRWYLEFKQEGIHEEIINDLVSWVQTVSEEDARELTEILRLFAELDQEHKLVEELYHVIKNTDVEFSAQEKVSLVKAFTKLPADLSFLKPILLEWKKDPSRIVEQFGFILRDVLIDGGELMRIANLMTHFSPEDTASMDQIFDSLGQDLAWVLSAWKEFDQLYITDKNLLSKLLISFRDWKNENEDLGTQVVALESLILSMTQNSKPVLKAFLEDEKYRKITTETMCELSKKQKTTQLIDLADEFRNSKGFENVFEMLRKYFD